MENDGNTMAPPNRCDEEKQVERKTPAGYRILKKCGEGAYGSVFLVEDISGRRLVLKQIFRRNASRLFMRELNGLRSYCAQNLKQRNLITIYHAADEQDYFYYTMPPADNLSTEPGDYCPASLENILARRRIEPLECIRVIRGLCNGIDELHEHGISHRDIKPGNILFVDGEPCLCDVGLVAGGDTPASLVGTFCFIPPELFSARMAFDSYLPEYDFYALGKVIYCMVSGLEVENFPLLRQEQCVEPAVAMLLKLAGRMCDDSLAWRLADSAGIRNELDRIEAKIARSGTDHAIRYGFAGRKKWMWLVPAVVIAGMICFLTRDLENPEVAPVAVSKTAAPPSEGLPLVADSSEPDRKLRLAIAAHDIENVKKLLNSGAVVNRLYAGQPALQFALRHNADSRMIQLLIDSGADMKIADNCEFRPIGLALRRPLSDEVWKLLFALEPVPGGEAGPHGKTLLHMAVEMKSVEKLRFLLEAGINPDAVDSHGQSALFKAVSHDFRELVETLLSYRANPVLRDKSQGATPLHLLPDSPELAELVMKNVDDLNMEMEDGTTPLLAAVRHGVGGKVIRKLLSRGADVNLANHFGTTPLLEAVAGGNMEIIELLIDSGADLRQVDKRGFSALHVAAIYGRCEVMQYLMKSGVPVDIADARGRTALHWAAIRDNADCVRLLLEGGSNRDSRDRDGRSPGDFASRLQCRGVRRILAPEAVPEKTATKENMKFPEVLAEIRSGREKLNRVIAAMPDLNLPDKDGVTPLIYCLHKNDNTAFALLLRSGADPDGADARGRRALTEALKLRNSYAVRLLLRYGAELNCGGTVWDTAAIPVRGDFQKGLQLLLASCRPDPDMLCKLTLLARQNGNAALAVFLESFRPAALCCPEQELYQYISTGNASGICDALRTRRVTANVTLYPWNSPLQSALQHKALLPCFKKLLEYGAQTQIVDEKGNSPLMSAVQTADPALVELLLSFGADSGYIAPNGESAFSLARRLNHFPILKTLSFYGPLTGP